MVGLPELFRGFASARMLVFGAVMMVMMVFRPQGLFPLRLPRFRTAELPNVEPASAEREAAP